MKSLIQQMQAGAEAQGSGGGKFLSMKDKDQFRIRFLQELDENAPGYSEKRGLAAYVHVHQNPKNFKKQALCTLATEGNCWACEQVNGPGKESYRWKPKARFYVNVLVQTPEGEKVKVLQQGMSDKHCAKALLEYAVEYGSITDRDYKIKRTGSDMNNTAYMLTALDKSPLPADVDELELFDLSALTKRVPSADQEAFFNETDEEESGW